MILSCGFASCKQTIKSVKIGSQVWMSENLSTDRFRNGDEIPLAETREEWIILCSEGKPASCYLVLNGEVEKSYGRLYNWFAVNDPRGLAPSGWHVPSDDEWKKLTDYLGGESIAAYKLRATGLNNGQESETGFYGKAAGGCKSDGIFFGVGSTANWWTSTEINSENAWMRQLSYTPCMINSLAYPKQSGLAIRCIKD